jgi:hypothetical protein
MSAIRSRLYQPTHVLAVELTLAFLAGFCLPIAACTDGSDRGLPPFPTAPQGLNYAGEWSGTTSESKTIQFSISSEQRITAISFGSRCRSALSFRAR